MRHIRATALQQLADSRASMAWVHEVDNNGHYLHSQRDRATVIGACFLKHFITLEEFLESSFAHYMTGKMSLTRWRPRKYARPPSTEHAHRMLIGTLRYQDWSTPSTVVKLAELYFEDGEPFKTPVISSLSHLQDMKTVRNSTAHISVTTQAALDGLYARWTGVPLAGVSADELLMTNAGGTDPATAGMSFFGATDQVVTSIVDQIANWQ